MTRTTTLAAELADAIDLAREAAAALVRAERDGAPLERTEQLRALSRQCERRVGSLTA